MNFIRKQLDTMPALRHVLKYISSKNYREHNPLFRTAGSSVSSFLSTKEVTICDVGAWYINSLDPGVHRFLKSNKSKLVLVEPQAEEADALKKLWEGELGKDRVTILKSFIGTGADIEFRVTSDTSASSGYDPNPDFHDAFPFRSEPLTVVKKVSAKTVTLDQALGRPIDHLIMDIQGMELDVLKSAPKTLNGLCVVETETDMRDLYFGQPLFGDMFNFMRSQGFEVFTFRKLGTYLRKEFKARASNSWYPWRSEFFEARELTFTQPVFVRTRFDAYTGDAEAVLRAARVLEGVYYAYDRAYVLLKDADKHFKTDNAKKYYASLPESVKAQ